MYRDISREQHRLQRVPSVRVAVAHKWPA
jgi:hypothetical protein